MFKCRECKSTFETPVKITESYGERWNVCPNCGSSSIDEAEHICELCGDYYAESIHDAVCESCINIIVDRFVEMFHENFTPFERSIINVAYDGRNLE